MAKTNNLTDFLTNTADAIRTAEGSTDAINPQDFEAKITALKLSVQTADATATAADILLGKTAYVDGAKITGTFSGYRLKGEWTFTSNLRYSTSTVNETINFYLMAAGTSGDSFTSMHWDNGVLTYTNAGGTSYTVYSAYNDEWSYPVVGDTKNINFGTTAQQVSEEFYNWFTSVATLNSGTSNPNTTTLTVTPNETIQTFNASDEGYLGYSQVTVNAIPEGYIQPSGTLTISENGTHDVTNYASAVVSISSYKGEWTAGTTYNTDDIVTYQGNVYRCLNENTDSIPANYIGMFWEKLNIADSTPIEISTDAGMEEVLTSDNVGKVYKFTGTTGTYTNGDLYVVEVG